MHRHHIATGARAARRSSTRWRQQLVGRTGMVSGRSGMFRRGNPWGRNVMLSNVMRMLRGPVTSSECDSVALPLSGGANGTGAGATTSTMLSTTCFRGWMRW